MDDEHKSHRQRKTTKKQKVQKSIVDHTYRDYSEVELSLDDKITAHDGTFPPTLHTIMSNPMYRRIICWQPHGRSWKILDKDAVASVICPKYFMHSRLASFNRSVNGWGFKRLSSLGPDCNTYYHECFLKGRPDICKLMKRLINPGKRLPDKENEPDFYEISRKYPLSLALAETSQEREIPTSASANLRYPFPHSQTGGRPYGYYQAVPRPQLPSSASRFRQPDPRQLLHQTYLPSQLPAPLSFRLPRLLAFGDYPHPQMIALQGYDPQSLQQSSMSDLYHPSTPRMYAAAQAHLWQIYEHGHPWVQSYQSFGTYPDRLSANGADMADGSNLLALEDSLRPAGAYASRPSALTQHILEDQIPYMQQQEAQRQQANKRTHESRGSNARKRQCSQYVD